MLLITIAIGLLLSDGPTAPDPLPNPPGPNGPAPWEVITIEV